MLMIRTATPQLERPKRASLPLHLGLRQPLLVPPPPLAGSCGPMPVATSARGFGAACRWSPLGQLGAESREGTPVVRRVSAAELPERPAAERRPLAGPDSLHMPAPRTERPEQPAEASAGRMRAAVADLRRALAHRSEQQPTEAVASQARAPSAGPPRCPLQRPPLDGSASSLTQHAVIYRPACGNARPRRSSEPIWGPGSRHSRQPHGSVATGVGAALPAEKASASAAGRAHSCSNVHSSASLQRPGSVPRNARSAPALAAPGLPAAPPFVPPAYPSPLPVPDSPSPTPSPAKPKFRWDAALQKPFEQPLPELPPLGAPAAVPRVESGQTVPTAEPTNLEHPATASSPPRTREECQKASAQPATGLPNCPQFSPPAFGWPLPVPESPDPATTPARGVPNCPRFSPPAFGWPLPVPESPAPTPGASGTWRPDSCPRFVPPAFGWPLPVPESPESTAYAQWIFQGAKSPPTGGGAFRLAWSSVITSPSPRLGARARA